MRTRETVAGLALMVAAAVGGGMGLAGGQPPTPVDPRPTPLEAATASKADAPATIAEPVKELDPEIAAVNRLLAGTFVADAAGGRPALRFSAATFPVEGLDSAVYFEVTRLDSPAAPFRQGVMSAYRFKDELRLRVFGLNGPAGLKESLTGFWAAPDALPELSTESLHATLDLVLTRGRGEGAYRGETMHPFPTMEGGAVQMTARIQLNEDQIALGDVGYDAAGMEAWGSPQATIFRRRDDRPIDVRRTDDGLVVLTIVPPPAENPKLVENGTITFHYTQWLRDGTRVDSSLANSRPPFTTRVPGGLFRGLAEGLKDMAKGERRRMLIPADMAFGSRGGRNVPPDSALVFDIECMHVDNTMPTDPAPGAATPPSTPPARPEPAGGTGEEPK